MEKSNIIIDTENIQNRDTWLVELWLSNYYENYSHFKMIAVKNKLKNYDDIDFVKYLKLYLHTEDEIDFTNVNVDELRNYIDEL